MQLSSGKLLAMAYLALPSVTLAASPWEVGNQGSYYQGDYGTG